MLGSIQKDIHELRIQASRIHVGTRQVSMEQASLAPRMSQATDLVRTLDLRTITFPYGSLCVDFIDDIIILSTIKNIGLNIAALSNKTLHALHAGVADELRDQEQCALNLINEYRVKNEKMFAKKMQDLKEKETLEAHSSRLESVVIKACKTVPEIHIPEDAQPEAKIINLIASVCEAKAEVG